MSRNRGLKILGILLFVALPLFFFNCGSQYSVKGYYNGMDYQASVRNVDIVAGVYSVNSYAMTDASLRVTINLNSYWGNFPDSIDIYVTNAMTIDPGVYYPIGQNGISVGMIILQTPISSPSGSIVFTKISLAYSKKVCAEFDLYATDGYVGSFQGSFCGDVQVGYEN